MDEAAALAALEPELRRALGAEPSRRQRAWTTTFDFHVQVVTLEEEVVLVSAARRWGFAALRGAVAPGSLGAGVEVAGGPSP